LRRSSSGFAKSDVTSGLIVAAAVLLVALASGPTYASGPHHRAYHYSGYRHYGHSGYHHYGHSGYHHYGRSGYHYGRGDYQVRGAARGIYSERFAGAWSVRPGGGIYGFRRSPCKTESCFEKHPEGSWVHPLTYPQGRPMPVASPKGA